MHASQQACCGFELVFDAQYAVLRLKHDTKVHGYPFVFADTTQKSSAARTSPSSPEGATAKEASPGDAGAQRQSSQQLYTHSSDFLTCKPGLVSAIRVRNP